MKDILLFIQSITASLAWPISTIIIILKLREPLVGVINRLNKIKYKGAEANFEKQIEDIKQSAELANVSYKNKKPKVFFSHTNNTEEIEQVANISPRAAIPLAWSKVETEITNLVGRVNISTDYPPYNSALKNISLLRENSYLDDYTYGLLESMRKLRNNVTHSSANDFVVTLEEALEYGKLAEEVSEKLSLIQKSE